ncbi:hypothetical protein ACHAWF_000213, partial [Thalassiosira exigua]
MKSRFGQHWTEFSSANSQYDQKYQPGGNALTILGNLVGRRSGSGADEQGRYCWYTLRGQRDEGVCIISAYRVCQTTPSQAGATSAYMQQYTHLRKEGQSKPNPRKQTLHDLLQLIRAKRAEGYRPVLMMDANGDYLADKDPDLELRQFLEDANLIDPYYEKFGSQARTYLHGSKRLDYPHRSSAVGRGQGGRLPRHSRGTLLRPRPGLHRFQGRAPISGDHPPTGLGPLSRISHGPVRQSENIPRDP